jgi:hypothetical protein
MAVRSDDVGASPKILWAATLLGSLVAFGTCEILRALRLARAPLTHEPNLFDHAHVTLGTRFMTTAFGALVLAWQLAGRSFVKALTSSLAGWLGPRLAETALRAWSYVGLPTLLFGWLMMKGTRAWNPNVTVWLLIAMGFFASIPVVWLFERAVRWLEPRARSRRGLVVVSAVALLALGAAAWASLTAGFGLRYGKSHLVTFAMLVIGSSLLLSYALQAFALRAGGVGARSRHFRRRICDHAERRGARTLLRRATHALVCAVAHGFAARRR